MSKINRKFVGFALALALVLSGAAAFVAQDTTALPANEVETTYYSNASKTTEVGYRLLTCFGSTIKSGQVTPYKTVFTSPCN